MHKELKTITIPEPNYPKVEAEICESYVLLKKDAYIPSQIVLEFNEIAILSRIKVAENETFLLREDLEVTFEGTRFSLLRLGLDSDRCDTMMLTFKSLKQLQEEIENLRLVKEY
ncbi:hypothetical protein P4L24_25300 [Bacillus cereus]|nr:hypothetical protein [Bacillus cereus]